MIENKYDVFICFKHSTADGQITEDSILAERLYDYLKGRGLRVFFSKRELEFLGVSQYNITISKALEASRFLIAVGCSRRNLESQWVQYEWSSFQNEIRSETKQNGELYVLYKDISPKDLPYALRQHQAFNAAEDGVFERICNFINNAIGRGRAGNEAGADVSQPVAPKPPTAPMPGIFQTLIKKKILIPAAIVVLAIVIIIINPWSNIRETPENEVSGSPPSETHGSDVSGPPPSETPENEVSAQPIVINLIGLSISDSALVSRIDSGEIPRDVTNLNLDGNLISDLTPLQSLTNLKELRLMRNSISNLTPLQSLTNLTELYLSDNVIRDPAPLKSLGDLQQLVIFNNPISEADIQDLQMALPDCAIYY